MIKITSLAPIVVFAYNRADHLKRTLEALSKNDLANDSDLFVFIDGPKNTEDENKVNDVNKLFENNNFLDSFKSLTIYNSNKNKGLARSIIDGVTKIISQYKKIIVVEDDVITSPFYLLYMNEALVKYEFENKIGSISSFVPEIKIPENYNENVFLTRRPTSIAWGTWLNRWENIDWDCENYFFQKYNIFRRYKINSWGNDVAGRLDRFKVGLNDSWAVRYTVHGILNKLYSIHPIETLAEHIGYDNSGTNCSKDDLVKFSVNITLSNRLELPNNLPDENKLIKKEFQQKYKRPILSEIGEFLLIVILRLKPKSKLVKIARKLSFKIKKIIE